MDTKQLIILFMALFLSSSCTREVLKEGGNVYGKTSVSLKVLLESEAGARAEDWEYDNFFPEMLDKEREVTNILLVVFRGNYLYEYDYYEKSEGHFTQDPNDYSITLDKSDGEDLLDLEPGPHYFFVLLNLNSGLKNRVLGLLKGQEEVLQKSVFERQVIGYSLSELTEDANGYFMTNTDPPAVRTIYSEEQIKNNTGLDNNVSIKVGRAVGKVSFAYVADKLQTGQLHGGLSNIYYKILNNPAQMYLTPIVENNRLLTPHYSYSNLTNYFSPTAKDADILVDKPNSPWLPATTTTTLANGDEKAFGYCMENHNQNALKSNSTMLLIEAKFNPTKWLDDKGIETTPDGDGTFYRIAHYATNGDRNGFWEGYYKVEPQFVLDSLNRHHVANPKGEYKSVEYKNGITYYGFWLSSEDRFQVKRNNYFQVAITHIHGAGDTKPGETIDPDIDPEEEATYGRISVKARSWSEEYMIVTVGEEPNENTGGIDPSEKEWEEEEQNKDLGGGDENNKFD